MRKATLLLLCLTLASRPSPASDVNTAGKLFLLAPGARSVGMGGCGTLLGEACSGLYNPAAQALTADVSGAIYINPHPEFGSAYEFLTLTMGARSEFGYIGFSYLSRQGTEGTDFPPEEASALVMAGRPSEKIKLTVGAAFKILASHKANFIALNESPSRTFKMAFDLGVTYSGLLPHSTLGKSKRREDDLHSQFGRPFPRGIAIGLAFQNLGGRIEYDYAIDIEMLPQIFRADLLWGIYESRWWDLRAAGQLQKLLVARNQAGGYKNATDAFFQAWGGGSREGGWTSHLGFELSLFSLASARMGWSADHGDHRSFTHAGLGLGPEWARFNIAWMHEPGADNDLPDELRYDLSAGVSYEQIRRWMNLD